MKIYVISMCINNNDDERESMKIAVVYFSKNSLFDLQVGYGISALKSMPNNETRTFYIEITSVKDRITDIIDFGPKIIIIFISFHCDEILLEFSQSIKEKMPNVRLAVCNNVASGLARQILIELKVIDFVVIGEYEETLLELCLLIDEKKDYSNCRGIAYMKAGIFYVNAPRKLMDIEKINYPEREEFTHDTRFFYMLGSRGCERNCSFCDRNYLYKLGEEKKPRFRKIESIIRELDYLVEKYNCKAVFFYDSTFCSNENIERRLEELYQILKTKKYWVQFSICLRAEQINVEVGNKIKQLKSVGLCKVFRGIDSFNESDLKVYNNAKTVDQN